MPIYEYKCESCGKIFTKIQKFADDPLTSHEECGSGPVERLISTPAFHFKGTGWYVTDYAKGGSSNAANGKSEGGEKSESKKPESQKSESKSESKPAETKSSGDSSPAPAKSDS